MRNHYVPVHYLRGFTLPGEADFTVQHDLASGKTERQHLRNTAVINDLYPDELEDFFTSVIESPALPLLKKIRDGNSLSDDEKPALTRYILALYRRGPRGKRLTLDTARRLLPEQLQMYREAIAELSLEGRMGAERRVSLDEQLASVESRYMAEVPEDVWHKDLRQNDMPLVRRSVNAMTWIYMVSRTTQGFVTADVPLWLPTGSGVSHPQAEIVFPVSSETCLVLVWHDQYRNQFRTVNADTVREVNRRIVLGADRFVFCNQKSPWIFRLRANKPPIRVFTPLR